MRLRTCHLAAFALFLTTGLGVCGQDLQTRQLRMIGPNGMITTLVGQTDSASITITLPSRTGRLLVEDTTSSSDGVPTGLISLFAGSTLPAGFLECNGAPVSRTLYPELFSILGESFGAGDHSTTFNLPVVSPPAPPIRTGLIGEWTFSNNTDDSSGAGNNAVLLNGAAYSTDRNAMPNSAVLLDGVNDQMKINAAFFNIGWTQYTFTAWVRIAVSVGNRNEGFGIFNTYPHPGIVLAAGEGGSTKYNVWLGNGAPGGWNGLLNAQGIHDYAVGQWQHLALVRNGFQVQLFIDGVLDNTFTIANAAPSVQCSLTLGSCSDNNLCLGMFNGKNDDFFVWNRALSSTEINQVSSAGTASGLLRYVIRAR